MKYSEYATYDAVGLAQLISQGQVSAGEVQQVARQAIAAVNPQLNALVGDVFAEPLPYAADGPFAGVPFLIKDLSTHAAGVPTRMGSRLTGDGITFESDPHLMTRFKRAGLATLGRTATPEFGFNATTESLANGPTHNPWDLSRSPGGSSGGSAALVAARAVPVAHATDGGGSIRIPSAWCGLVGLKPTRGRIGPGPDASDPLFGLAIQFGLARTVRDVAALLDVAQGAGVGDKYVIAPPTRPYAQEVGTPPGRLRIALTTQPWSGVPVDQEYVQAVESIGHELEALGHVVEIGSPRVDWETFIKANATLWATNIAYNVTQLANALHIEPGPEVLEATILTCLEYARQLSVFDVCAAEAICNTVNRSVGAFFTSYDVLLTPTVAGPPPALGYLNANDASLDMLGWLNKIFDLVPFTPLFNVTGQPAISLPLKQDTNGLPIGLQFVARFGDEATLLRLAAQLEQALPWSDRHPGIGETAQM